MTKDELQRRIEEAVRPLAGNMYEFTQPIQMRFNELIAGVRGDIAIKVFGEEFEPMLRVADRIGSILRGTKGAEDVKVEQVTGLPVLDIKIDKAAIARLGLSVATVQDVIGAAIGGCGVSAIAACAMRPLCTGAAAGRTVIMPCFRL